MIRWESICEPDMMAAFERLGQELDIWDYTLEKADTDYDTTVVEKLSQTLLSKQYDFVFTVDYFPVVARVCNVVKVRYVSWSVDCPVKQYYSKSLALPYNRIFLFDYAMFQEFAGENPNNTFYLPLGVNAVHADEVIDSITEEDRKRFACDVSFVGSTYQEKCQFNRCEEDMSDYTKGYAQALIEAQLNVYGSFFLEDVMSNQFVEAMCRETGWTGLPEDYNDNVRAFIAQMVLGEKVTEQERLRLLKRISETFSLDIYTLSDLSGIPKAHNRGSAESWTEMRKIFHLSKINLNPTSKAIRTGISQRVWDVLGAGGFLLSNYQTEIPEYLEPGVDIELYGSFEECEEKIAYYLSHEEERKEIARNGYEKVRRHHTYEHRVKEMLEVLMSEE